MSLLHKAITLSGACAIGLTLAFAAPAAAEDAKPINFRAVGGAVLGGTWNVGLTGVGKLVNDRYPGSAINVLQGASVSNPLRLEQNAADVTLTQTFNTVAARDGKAPYKKPLKNVASLANMNDTSRLSIIVSADLPVNTFDELMEKKLPVRLDRGAKGTLHNVVGAMLLAEYGYTYDAITKWGGAHTAVSANDRVGMFQDGTLNAYLTLGPGQQSHIQELVLNAKVKWLPVSDKVLKSVTAKTGQSIGVIPADFYGGAVGRDIPPRSCSSARICRTPMSTRSPRPSWKVLRNCTPSSPRGRRWSPNTWRITSPCPCIPARKSITVRPASSSSPLARSPFPARCSHGSGIPSRINENPAHIRTRLIGKRFRKHPATLPCPAAFRRAYHRKRTTSWSSISVSALRTKAS